MPAKKYVFITAQAQVELEGNALGWTPVREKVQLIGEPEFPGRLACSAFGSEFSYISSRVERGFRLLLIHPQGDSRVALRVEEKRFQVLMDKLGWSYPTPDPEPEPAPDPRTDLVRQLCRCRHCGGKLFLSRVTRIVDHIPVADNGSIDEANKDRKETEIQHAEVVCYDCRQHAGHLSFNEETDAVDAFCPGCYDSAPLEDAHLTVGNGTVIAHCSEACAEEDESTPAAEGQEPQDTAGDLTVCLINRSEKIVLCQLHLGTRERDEMEVEELEEPVPPDSRCNDCPITEPTARPAFNPDTIEDGDDVIVTDPKHASSMHNHGFRGIFIGKRDGAYLVRDQEDDVFSVEADEIEGRDQE